MTFRRSAANGQVVGHSELYFSASAMEGGIASVKKNRTPLQARSTTRLAELEFVDQ